MTPERLNELRALHDAATGGVWEDQASVHVFTDDSIHIADCGVHFPKLDFVPELSHSEKTVNAQFIAAAHNALPELLDDVERLNVVADAAKRLHNALVFTSPSDGVRAHHYHALNEALNDLEAAR